MLRACISYGRWASRRWLGLIYCFRPTLQKVCSKSLYRMIRWHLVTCAAMVPDVEQV